MNVTNLLIHKDRILDYVPVMSTFSNLHILFQKYVLKDIPYLEMPDRYYQHIQDKSICRCLTLLIPVIGNILIALYDLVTSYKPPIEQDMDVDGCASELDFKEMEEEQISPLVNDEANVHAEKPIQVEMQLGDLTTREETKIEGLREITDPVHELAKKPLKIIEELKDQKAAVMRAIEQDPAALEFASERLKNAPGLLKLALKKDGLLLRFASKESKDDELTVNLAIEQNGSALELASDRLRNDQDFLEPILKKDGLLLRFAGNKARDNFTLVYHAFNQNPAALEFASAGLKIFFLDRNNMRL